MYKGDLFLPYFLCKFSKNTCIFQFYVLQYNYSKGYEAYDRLNGGKYEY